MKASFYIENRNKFSSELKENSVAVLFAGKAPQRSADQEYEFTPNRHFYYLTGIEMPNMILVLANQNGVTEEKIYIEKADPILEKWIGKRLTVDEVKEISGIEKVFFLEDFESHFQRLMLSFPYQNLYLDLEQRGELFATKALQFAKEVNTKYPFLQVLNAYHIISDLRTIKNDEEISEIKKAIKMTKTGIEALMTNAKSGILERQLEAYFDFSIKYDGAKTRSFKTIAASGKNATVLHYEDNNTNINDGDLILFDLGVESNYYCSDISRTIPINGKFTDRQKEVYNAVLDVEEKIINMIKPGVKWIELHTTARDLLAEKCIELGLIEDKKDVINYYYHGIGHYLGLDVHDVGQYYNNYERVLEPGMVFTVEPGLYIEEEGIGIRIEDDVLVTEDGCENLSKDIIKTVEDIESFMKK